MTAIKDKFSQMFTRLRILKVIVHKVAGPILFPDRDLAFGGVRNGWYKCDAECDEQT